MVSIGNLKLLERYYLHNKYTLSDKFDLIHRVVLYGISDIMASLEDTGIYFEISTIDTSIMGYYVDKLIYISVNLQQDNRTDDKVFKSG